VHPDVDAMNRVGMLVKAVVAQLVADEEEQEDATGHTNGQPDYVYCRVCTLPAERAQGHQEVVLNHAGAVCNPCAMSTARTQSGCTRVFPQILLQISRRGVRRRTKVYELGQPEPTYGNRLRSGVMDLNRTLFVLLLASSVGACTPQDSATIEGSATYRERIALPPDAQFEATLEDVSVADAPAEGL